MGNMHYCRFENTYNDFRECYHALQNGELPDISAKEQKFAIRLVKLASRMAKDFYEEVCELEDEFEAEGDSINHDY